MTNFKGGLIFCFLVFLLATAQALAQENFANAWPAIGYYTKNRIKVAVIDDREYVKSGKKSNSYLGVVRSAYGIPLDVSSANSAPLAEDLEKAISNGFSNAGMTSIIADSVAKSNRKSSSADEKLLVVTLSEWVSDSFRNSVDFTYKVTADVYNHEGIKMASTTAGNKRTFNTSLESGRDALTQLLSSSDIIASLTKKTTEPSEKASDKKYLAKGSDPKSRLLVLKELLDSGAISSADYEKKKQEILSAF